MIIGLDFIFIFGCFYVVSICKLLSIHFCKDTQDLELFANYLHVHFIHVGSAAICSFLLLNHCYSIR